MTTTAGRSRPARWPHRDDGRRPARSRPRSRSATGGSSRSGRRRRSRRWIGPRTRVVELRGRTVTPGFGDAHVHPVSAGLGRLRCDLDGAARARCLPRDRSPAYAAAHPDEPWIRGDGWSMADFPGGIPHRDDLDRVVPDRPVYLESRDGHTAWVNSPGARAGRRRPPTRLDPDDGRIERDADGRPSAARSRRARPTSSNGCCPRTTPDELVAGLRLAQAELHAPRHHHTGRTRSSSPIRARSAYTTLAGRGELTGPRRRRAVVGSARAAPSRSRSSSSGARGRPSAATRRRASS